MQPLLENAAIAWNPIGQARIRLREGTLSVGEVLVPFLGIVVACNLVAAGGQTFFYESVFSSLGSEMPDVPLVSNEFSQRVMSALGVLVPVGAVALLPGGLFEPVGKSTTIAAMLVVAAGWSFYGAAISIPVYFTGGILAGMDGELGLTAFFFLSIPMTLGIVALTLWFWFRILVSELGLGGGSVAVITIVSVVALGLVAGLVSMVAMSSV